MAYIFENRQCPVRVPSGFWAREREPTAFALTRRISVFAKKQATDLTPQLAASPSDHEQGNT
jgi:hypothetical protein